MAPSPVGALQVSGGTLSAALDEVLRLCERMKESADMCRRLHARLEATLAKLQQLEQEQSPAVAERALASFGDTVAALLKFLRKYADQHFLLRLTSSRKIEHGLHAFHADVSTLWAELGATEDSSPTAQEIAWRQDQETRLKTLTSVADDTDALLAELEFDDTQEDVTTLAFELEHRADEYQDDAAATRHLSLMRRTLSRAVSLPDVEEPSNSEWFIPRDEVDFDDDVSLDRGIHESIHRGTWRGTKQSVIVRRLVEDNKATRSLLSDEVSVWFRLRHRNVIATFGACHLGFPAFIVTEDAVNGNFVNYFQSDLSRVWQLFYQTACGLQYLHEQGVTHGDLKCNRVLVGRDGQAKIVIPSKSLGPPKDAVRWKSPEWLQPSGAETWGLRVASDIFSLGRCIIEAFEGEPPYGLQDDETITDMVLAGQPYPRPGGLQDDEWALVERLCEHEWQRRISLPAAVDALESFADREREARARAA